MARTKALTELTVADLWKEVKDPATLWGDLTPQARRTLKLLLQNRMHEELTAYLGAERYARRAGRGGVRNGVYRRQLITTWGTIPDLEIPRSRDGGFRPAVVPRYQRRMADVDRLIRSVFLAGVSTRRVGRTLAEILGDQVSASTVSTITRTLDHAVSAWHRRPLPDQYRYLILDGLSLRVKTPDGAKRRQILVAYGIRPNGRRALIDYRFVPQESQGTWEAFLANLACRGLVGQHLALARRIYAARSRPAAETALRRWVRAWQAVAPDAVAPLLRDWEALLAFHSAPEQDWRRIRTTNAIERAFREVRRRTRPMTCFTNLASCDRIVHAVMHYLNAQWGTRPLSRESTQNS